MALFFRENTSLFTVQSTLDFSRQNQVICPDKPQFCKEQDYHDNFSLRGLCTSVPKPQQISPGREEVEMVVYQLWFSRKTEPMGDTYLQIQVLSIYIIYYNELAHLIMDEDKSHGLQGESASWRLRRADGLVLTSKGYEPGEMVVSYHSEDPQA